MKIILTIIFKENKPKEIKAATKRKAYALAQVQKVVQTIFVCSLLCTTSFFGSVVGCKFVCF